MPVGIIVYEELRVELFGNVLRGRPMPLPIGSFLCEGACRKDPKP